STPGTPATLTVEMRGEAGDRAELVCRSVNESPAELTQVPRSLNRRAKAVGGACAVTSDAEQRNVVEVALLVRFLAPSAVGASARPSTRSSKRSSTASTSVSDAMIDLVGNDMAIPANGAGTAVPAE